MFTVLDEHSVLFIILSEWAPPLITILVGGLVASILIPRWQDAHARYHAREARRLALAEELSRNFSRYTTALSQLHTISKLEQSRALDDTERARKLSFVEARNNGWDALSDTFCNVQMYFADNTYAIIEEFIAWDRANINKRMHGAACSRAMARKAICSFG